MTSINKEVLELTGQKLQGHLYDYEQAIEKAYLTLEEGALSIALGVKFSEEKGCMRVETSITFVADKVKDKGLLLYDPNDKKKMKQLPLSKVENFFHEILFRDFSKLRKELKILCDGFHRQYLIDFDRPGALVMRRFDIAA